MVLKFVTFLENGSGVICILKEDVCDLYDCFACQLSFVALVGSSLAHRKTRCKVHMEMSNSVVFL
jgi:hypothetical protein